MPKFKLLVIAVVLLLVAACKKDNTQQSTITFNINGNAKSITIYTNTLTTKDTLGVQAKTLVLASSGVIAGPALNSGFALIITQNLTSADSTPFSPGAYPDQLVDTACQSSGFSPRCAGFFFSYYDGTYGSLTSTIADTLGTLNITSFSTSTDLISGNFNCRVIDHNGNYYNITGGQFSNVAFVAQ